MTADGFYAGLMWLFVGGGFCGGWLVIRKGGVPWKYIAVPLLGAVVGWLVFAALVACVLMLSR